VRRGVLAYGVVALELIVADWQEESPRLEGYRETPEDIKALLEHEHDSDNFIEMTSGLPFLSREVSGMNLGGGA
jgi:hypothetical protein